MSKSIEIEDLGALKVKVSAIDMEGVLPAHFALPFVALLYVRPDLDYACSRIARSRCLHVPREFWVSASDYS